MLSWLSFNILTFSYNTFIYLSFGPFLGTTSSNNTVVAGQECFPDSDDTKTVKENEERYDRQYDF